ncbi:MAG TPA: RusA family crossover junction endodeoxyribonuclease [Acidimicrobiia bacterium]
MSRPADTVTFFVHGTPKPQGSKRAFVNKATGRAQVVESSKGVGDWRADVRAAAMAEWGEKPPTVRPVAVVVHFYLRRPKRHPKTKQTYPTARPDVDKLLRAVLDALTGIVFKDDAQVITLTGTKEWDQDESLTREGAKVTVYEVLP